MPERETEEETFIILMDTLKEGKDVGFVEFEQEMNDTLERLQDQYVRKGNHLIDDEKILRAVEELNAAWPYSGRNAIVSGRLFIHNDELSYRADQIFDGIEIDDIQGEHGVAEQVVLRSEGIEVLPVYDESDRLIDINVGYVFSYADDPFHTAALFARYGELDQHAYDVLSHQEVVRRLETQWPKQFDIIEHIAMEQGTSMVERLYNCTDALQVDLVNSAEFRMLVEQYIQYVMPLDTVMPYDVTVNGSLEVSEAAERTDDQDEDGPWYAIKVDAPIRLTGKAHSLSLRKKRNENVGAFVTIDIFSYEDDTAERVRIPIESIVRLRSQRTRQSLVSRAFSVPMLDHATVPPEVFEASDESDAPDIDSVAGEALAGTASSVENEAERHDPEYIQNLRRFNEAIEAWRSIVRTYENRRYDTEDEAMSAATDLIEHKITPYFNGVKNPSEIELRLSGEGVTAVQLNTKSHQDFDDEGKFVRQVLEQTPAEDMMPFGDKLSAAYGSFDVLLIPHQIEGEDEEMQEFSFTIVMNAGMQSETIATVRKRNVVVGAVTEIRQAVVDPTEDINIELPALERYETVCAEVDELLKRHENDPAVRLLDALREQFFANIVPHGFVAFKHETPLFALNQFMKSDTSEADDKERFMAILEKLFLDRPLKFVAAEDEDGSQVRNEEGGIVVDVRRDKNKNEIYLSLGAGEDVTARQFSLSTISDIQF